MRCPSCGAWLSSGLRECSYCHVELASVRCARCFALHYAGSAMCSRCGATLGLEGTLGETDSACPRCTTAKLLRIQVGAHDILECPRCTGVFLEHAVMERVTRATEVEAGARLVPPKTKAPPLQPVRYLPCPLCAKVMMRRNFGETSGLIVDVCTPHGVWFDADELPAALAFVLDGGLSKQRAREHARLEEARRKLIEQRRATGRISGGIGEGFHDTSTLEEVAWAVTELVRRIR